MGLPALEKNSVWLIVTSMLKRRERTVHKLPLLPEIRLHKRRISRIRTFFRQLRFRGKTAPVASIHDKFGYYLSSSDMASLFAPRGALSLRAKVGIHCSFCRLSARASRVLCARLLPDDKIRRPWFLTVRTARPGKLRCHVNRRRSSRPRSQAAAPSPILTRNRQVSSAEKANTGLSAIAGILLVYETHGDSGISP